MIKNFKLFENKINYNYKLLIKDNTLVLYNDMIDNVLGILNLAQTNNDNVYYVASVGAEKGLGTKLYEYALMYIYSDFMIPSRDGDVTGEAFNIWKKFYNRNDIEKIENSDIFSDNFYFSLITGEDEYLDYSEKKEIIEYWNENDEYSKNIKELMIFNTKYRKKPNKEYIKLINESNNINVGNWIFDVDYSTFFK